MSIVFEVTFNIFLFVSHTGNLSYTADSKHIRAFPLVHSHANRGSCFYVTEVGPSFCAYMDRTGGFPTKSSPFAGRQVCNYNRKQLSSFQSTTAVNLFVFCVFINIVSGVRLSPLGTAATTGLLYQPQTIDDGDCGEIGGMKIRQGKPK
jgi:hypothetical protein